MKRIFFTLFCGILLPLAALEITPARGKYDYRRGEKVTFHIQLDKGRGNGVFQVRLQDNSRLAYTQKLTADAQGKAQLTLTARKPGFLHVSVTDQGKTAAAAVAVDAEKIQPARNRSESFDRHWRNIRKAMDITPVKYEIAEITSQHKDFKTFEVTIFMPEKSAPPAYAVMTMQKNASPGRLAAHLIFYDHDTDKAQPVYQANTLTVTVNPLPLKHGNIAGAALQKGGKFHNYQLCGADDLKNNIFCGMFQRAAASVQFVKTLPEWDNRTLIVSGSGQGGAQAIAAAGLDKRVTMCVAIAPALGNHGGFENGTESGWPGFYRSNRYQQNPDGALAVLDVIDSCFFAQNIRNAEVIVYCGYNDEICPPSSIYAIYNMILSENKKIYADVIGKHLPSAKISGEIDRKIKEHTKRRQAAFR